MELEKILGNLCYRDARNPSFEELYGEDDEPPTPRHPDCFCNNCFSGRDSLALEILRLRSKIDELKKKTGLLPPDFKRPSKKSLGEALGEIWKFAPLKYGPPP